MNKKNFLKNYAQIFTATDYCITKNLTMPALVLIYSAIDSVSWLANENENQKVADCFQTWVDTWMLSKYPLPCTAVELYAARCGIIHTLTPNSLISRKKGIRQISYAWGTAKQKDLEEAIKLLQYGNLVAVHITDLYHSFRNGFVDFLENLEKDTKRQEYFAKKASTHFATTKISTINEFLALSKNGT